MRLNESTILLLGYCLRMFLISFTGQFLGVHVIAGVLLKRRRSTVPMLTFGAMKFILLVCVLQTLFIDQLQVYAWYELLCLAVSVCSAVSMAFLFYITYHGSAIKCITAMNISEILVSVFMLPAVMIVNILQKRDNIFLFTHPFRISDFLIPVVMGGICFLFCKLTKSFMMKFRTYQLKYPKFWWAAYIIYVSSLQLMSVIDLRNNNDFVMSMYIVFLVSAGTGTAGFFLLYLNHHRKIRLERGYLNTQLNLLETHYQAIQNQMQQMEGCQKIIAQQMEEITSGKAVLKDSTKEYLNNLKEEYSKLRAGMYCDDWRIDAVLYCQIEAARSHGIEVDCQIRGYDGKRIQQQTLAQLLFLLLHNSICILQEEDEIRELGQKNSAEYMSWKKLIRVQTGSIKEKLVIQFFASTDKKEQILNKQVRKLIKENGGMLDLEMKENSSSVVITF